jgi:hypothetical protein
MSKIEIRYIESIIGRMDEEETLDTAIEVRGVFLQSLTDASVMKLLERALTDDQKAECAALWGDE